MKACVSSSGKMLATRITVAETVAARVRGLLGRKELPAGEGLLIRPCMSIHTFFMKFPIDAVFLDGDNRIVALHRALPPNRMTRIYPKARSVLELPAGTLDENIQHGELIEFS